MSVTISVTGLSPALRLSAASRAVLLAACSAPILAIEEPELHLHPMRKRSGSAKTLLKYLKRREKSLRVMFIDNFRSDFPAVLERVVCGSLGKKERDAISRGLAAGLLAHELAHLSLSRELEQKARAHEEAAADQFAGMIGAGYSENENFAADHLYNIQPNSRPRTSHRVRSVRSGTSASDGDGDGGDGDGDGDSKKRVARKLLAEAASHARDDHHRIAINELATRWLSNPHQLPPDFNVHYVNRAIKNMVRELARRERHESRHYVHSSCERDAGDFSSAVDEICAADDTETTIRLRKEIRRVWRIICERAKRYVDAMLLCVQGYDSHEIARKLSTREKPVKECTVRKWIDRTREQLPEPATVLHT